MAATALHGAVVRAPDLPALAHDVGAGGPVDLCLNPLVGIRLLDATANDVAVVLRQLGPVQAPLERAPDITIRFVDELPLAQPLRFVGLQDAGFTDDAFVVLRGRHRAAVRVQIPFDRLGAACEIVCERGLPWPPHVGSGQNPVKKMVDNVIP